MSKPAVPSLSFQDLILTLHHYWSKQGCVILQPYDVEVGAGTLHPATVLRALGKKPWKAAYVQPSRRPVDGRYAENPTVGAWGLGWEVWCDGMEVTQYTYFQGVGGIEVDVVSGELTYGLERLCMYLQNVDNVYDLRFNNNDVLYGDVFREQERQFSAFNFEAADVPTLKRQFEDMERRVGQLLTHTDNKLGYPLVLPAYDHVLKASHLFNLMDAAGAIAVAERQSYIGRIRDLCKACALEWARQEEVRVTPSSSEAVGQKEQPSSSEAVGH